MTEPSSTSSSDTRRPRLAWGPLLAWPLLAALVLIAAMEAILAGRGFEPGIADSEERWRHERRRAPDLGPRALVLLGASRIHLGADLDVLAARTGLTPVQLAIDAGSFFPVLEGLARDPAFRGSVIVDFSEGAMLSPDAPGLSRNWEQRFQAASAGSEWNYRWVESRLVDATRGNLRSYADGATPLGTLVLRVLDPTASPQYLVTRRDRSRLADYGRVKMPDHYWTRVRRQLESHEGPGADTARRFGGSLAQRIAALQPADAAGLVAGLARFENAVQAIQARGGRVILVRMPTSGLILQMEQRVFPRERFWEPVAAATAARTVHFADDPEMRTLLCPDGSHLDRRDRARFTEALVRAAGLGRPET